MDYICDTIKAEDNHKRFLIYPGGYYKGRYSGNGRRPKGVEHEILHPYNIYGFDLDGTIADIQHRLRYITGKKDYKKFYESCVDDLPRHDVVHLMRELDKENIYIFTGRSSTVLVETVKWLKRWNVPYARLYMRHEGNYEKSTTLKARMVEDIKHRIRFMVDDSPSVVDMWRSMGITALYGDWFSTG